MESFLFFTTAYEFKWSQNKKFNVKNKGNQLLNSILEPSLGKCLRRMCAHQKQWGLESKYVTYIKGVNWVCMLEHFWKYYRLISSTGYTTTSATSPTNMVTLIFPISIAAWKGLQTEKWQNLPTYEKVGEG